MTADSQQYVIVYGHPKERPTVYGTAYRETERANVARACMRRYPESEDMAVRCVRAIDLDPTAVHGPSHL